MSSEALHVACNNPELYKQIKTLYQEVISKKVAYDAGVRGPRNSINTDGGPSASATTPIGDPAKVNTKGAPKGKNKGKSNVVSKNGRPLGYDEKKRLKLCSVCKMPGHNKNSVKCKLHHK